MFYNIHEIIPKLYVILRKLPFQLEVDQEEEQQEETFPLWFEIEKSESRKRNTFRKSEQSIRCWVIYYGNVLSVKSPLK